MNISDAIYKRRSAMAFEPQILPNETIEKLFEASRWAPSSYNEQPWRFYYVNRINTKLFNDLVSFLAPANAEWASNSSLLVFSVAKKQLTTNGKPNFYALHDTGMATANILVQAEGLGLVTHIMGGFNRDAVGIYLNLSSEFEVVAAIAIGLAGNIELLSEPNRKRVTSERVRKPLNEIVFSL